MGWSVEFVTCHGSKHTDRECVSTQKGNKVRLLLSLPHWASPRIFVFSVTTKFPHSHHEKVPNAINLVWLLCKILNPGLQRPDNPQVEGGGGNNRNWSMYKCSWLMHVVDLCWMLMLLSDFKRLVQCCFALHNCTIFCQVFRNTPENHTGLYFTVHVVVNFSSTLNIWLLKTEWKSLQDFSRTLIIVEIWFHQALYNSPSLLSLVYCYLIPSLLLSDFYFIAIFSLLLYLIPSLLLPYL